MSNKWAGLRVWQVWHRKWQIFIFFLILSQRSEVIPNGVLWKSDESNIASLACWKSNQSLFLHYSRNKKEKAKQARNKKSTIHRNGFRVIVKLDGRRMKVYEYKCRYSAKCWEHTCKKTKVRKRIKEKKPNDIISIQ